MSGNFEPTQMWQPCYRKIGKSAKTMIDSARKHVADVVGASSEGEFDEIGVEIMLYSWKIM